ncbi:hypothetical protein ACH42_13740 [Endozoicomonas sp. (ex Bugula neritina AB1)]|nr:hypothetical protein ACH42_13740 [Endozoicomonas sp. (ex Bugula neritina AB1)]
MTNNKLLRKLTHLWVVAITAALLSACQTSGPSSLYAEGLPGTARWAVLPFVNHSQVEGEMTIQLERIMMVNLPSAGVVEPKLYPETVVTTASEVLADAHRLQNGKQWAYQTGMSFAITGEVYDWSLSDDGHALVSVNLEVVDIRTDKQLWAVSGTGEGLPGESNYDVSRKLFSELLSSLPINRPQ